MDKTNEAANTVNSWHVAANCLYDSETGPRDDVTETANIFSWDFRNRCQYRQNDSHGNGLHS